LCLRSDRISGPAKALILRHLWNGYTRDELEAQAVRYTEVIIPTILRRRLYQQLQAWKKEGAQVAIVSASLDVWLAPFCAQEGFTLISTRSVWGAQGQWTGFEGLNCNGAEKARRIREVFDLKEFKRIYAHGNTKGDLPMLQLAHTAWMWRGNTAKKVF
jgi:HAD superfamily phosphoserine phosphatase-like hydrolase